MPLKISAIFASVLSPHAIQSFAEKPVFDSSRHVKTKFDRLYSIAHLESTVIQTVPEYNTIGFA
jgi:hypothetical protein